MEALREEGCRRRDENRGDSQTGGTEVPSCQPLRSAAEPPGGGPGLIGFGSGAISTAVPVISTAVPVISTAVRAIVIGFGLPDTAVGAIVIDSGWPGMAVGLIGPVFGVIGTV